MLKLKVSKRDFIILIAMSVIGLISSSTVLYEIYALHNLPPFCQLPESIGSITFNCAKVLLSSYSNFGPVSLDFLAAVWFIVNIVLVVIISYSGGKLARHILRFLFGWRFFGIVVVAYLLYLELLVVRSICLYCTVMHIAIIIDFVIISYLLFSKNSKTRQAILSES
ncbi:vitamin K epoxide reductase family protein [Candidatus Parvarchaeota archaeon]|nr:vitamin K epoxide reductase family protein [Candidatus Acidifodinimicrobium mancum]